MNKTVIIGLYLFSIVVVNFIFAHTTPIDTPLGYLPPATFIVGAIFVLRDYVQRYIGHYVLLVMIVACALSYYIASPIVATASLLAFIASELSDWGIYTAIKRKFEYRVLYSSMVGVLVDSVVFLPLVGLFSWGAVLVMWLSKMVAAVIIFSAYRIKNDSLSRG
jgi:uncharacterized PurR-regulated membrane protein YhhQ (DUF165 family)